MDLWKSIITLLIFCSLIVFVSAVDVWDRPVYQIDYNTTNLSNYYTISQIDYFFSQVYNELNMQNNSINSLYNIIYDLNITVNELSYNVSVLQNFTQEINDSLLFPFGDYFIIDYPNHQFEFNTSKNNLQIKNISKIYEYEYDMNIIGNGYNISTTYIGFEIKEVIVIPVLNNSVYRFQLAEYPSYDIIDRDRIPHQDIWAIEKNYPINYTQVIANITNADSNNNFTIRIKYLSNGVE